MPILTRHISKRDFPYQDELNGHSLFEGSWPALANLALDLKTPPMILRLYQGFVGKFVYSAFYQGVLDPDYEVPDLPATSAIMLSMVRRHEGTPWVTLAHALGSGCFIVESRYNLILGGLPPCSSPPSHRYALLPSSASPNLNLGVTALADCAPKRLSIF